MVVSVPAIVAQTNWTPGAVELPVKVWEGAVQVSKAGLAIERAGGFRFCVMMTFAVAVQEVTSS